MWRAGCVFVLIVAAAVSAPAQDKPDYSGNWTLVDASMPRPIVASSLAVRQPVTRTNVRGEPMPSSFLDLIVERTFVGRTTTDTHQIGVQGGFVWGAGFQTRFSVTREDNRLVMATASYSGSGSESRPTSEHNEVWELDPDGMLIISVTDTETGREPKSTRLTYRRN
jgi:hypothetical protein